MIEHRMSHCARCGEQLSAGVVGQVAFIRTAQEFSSQGLQDLVVCLSCPNTLTEHQVQQARLNGWTRAEVAGHETCGLSEISVPTLRACARATAFCADQATVEELWHTVEHFRQVRDAARGLDPHKGGALGPNDMTCLDRVLVQLEIHWHTTEQGNDESREAVRS